MKDKSEFEIREQFADILHELWSNWYKYQRDNSNKENIERWERQSKTPYKKLPEIDKAKDRALVEKHFAKFIEDYIARIQKHGDLGKQLYAMERKINEHVQIFQMINEILSDSSQIIIEGHYSINARYTYAFGVSLYDALANWHQKYKNNIANKDWRDAHGYNFIPTKNIDQF